MNGPWKIVALALLLLAALVGVWFLVVLGREQIAFNKYYRLGTLPHSRRIFPLLARPVLATLIVVVAMEGRIATDEERLDFSPDFNRQGRWSCMPAGHPVNCAGECTRI